MDQHNVCIYQYNITPIIRTSTFKKVTLRTLCIFHDPFTFQCFGNLFLSLAKVYYLQVTEMFENNLILGAAPKLFSFRLLVCNARLIHVTVPAKRVIFAVVPKMRTVHADLYFSIARPAYPQIRRYQISIKLVVNVVQDLAT